MEIRVISNNKKELIDLLLLADEQEDMIDQYLERGDLFALYEGDLKAICVVTNEGEGIYELKNIATYPKYQRQGYGKLLIDYIFEVYKGQCKIMLVGTGNSPLTIPFYQRCGFEISHIVKNFFTDHYDHPIFECGVQLVDMIYLKKEFA